MADERREFEHWWRSKTNADVSDMFTRNPDTDMYVSNVLQASWETWVCRGRELNRLREENERYRKAKNLLSDEMERQHYRANMAERSCTCRRELDGVPTEPGWYWYQPPPGEGGIRAVECMRGVKRDSIVAVTDVPIHDVDYVEYMGGTWYGPICEPEGE